MAGWWTRSERRSLLFYVPDGIAPWPSQPVRWALDFTIGFLGGDESLRDEVIERLDLRPLLDQPMGTLSKGQRKRVLLAIGLLTPQPVLLIDEPFEGLDLRQARDIAHGAAGTRGAGPDAVPVDSPDRRCGAVLRPVRAA